ncbi:CDP-diacylglycerol--glycerol-3-phosphate 3-phosphatidyltransferase [Friedmanniomyces endolithicus]|uniref:CDP-diacylglycerol--glycerol-3-phosphate 3-phosphatidyltransferase n=1 Tax=Friedmanniomyces endolithicus TaxID=329885 RepID=A0AAN6G3U2_9PEZI|nr:CDP-diacylglycerol--glycerol-3-phosphate 3-phosphatidyltransferase [Friedmanniomyces endolithicus]KAK0291339.1 CDP-diacylglycerol--glycerol-3-phosphate 3-phosphatidyltransferase [Friedmanniomyces endolithicus]KAK0328740.1 CDP-diacylglycerol--glycerol-3-phosphate 3-phosphatidyltransferase [Friedmanniomyces endolithicus]KAK1019565.1 CDP-diacylglycerol--glycerol-3-phosphate 3-phosphatidyltransferase [Friedmanniomyces endolithicus]
MIIRRVVLCSRHAGYRLPSRVISQGAKAQRRLSTAYSAPVAATHTAPSQASPLASITSELDKLTPRFDVSADDIEIIRSPSDFFEALKSKITKARRRVYLSTLYVGKTEHELINTIRTALKTNPTLTVSVLTDYLRGTREAPDPSCASLLASLITDFPDRVEVRLYHTPNLTGIRKAILPKRINEGWGLQHMKLYGIDDEIIMSGANLSDDYFTNRQDRYHIIKSKEVTDFFSRIYRTVSDLSYRVLPSDKESSGLVIEWPESNVQPAPLVDPKGYITAATNVLAPFTQPPSRSPKTTEKPTDTHIYPLLQLTPLLKPDTSTELPALTTILRALSTPAFSGSKWTFTAGYFNMTPEIRQLLLSSHPASATVIAASPWANGFYGSKGVSGMLPAAYTHLSRRFLDAVSGAGLSQHIALKEWRKGTVNTPGGWTYHAKGIWVTLPGVQRAGPSISLVGSSNYTKRSYSLDLEANTLIVTSNADLQRRLGEEEKWLQEYAKVVTRDDYAKTERRVGLHVRVAMWIVTLVGGAL